MQTTAAEAAAAEQRINAAAMQAAAKAFPEGAKVTSIVENDMWSGAVGTVQKPDSGTQPGQVRVTFPKGTWNFASANLRRA